MRPLRLVSLTCLIAAASAVEGAPGIPYRIIETEHLRVMVPAHAVETLRPLAARAEAVYAHLAADAGYRMPQRPYRLILWLSDDTDSHNGFSTVVPSAFINVQMAPSLPESFIFSGTDHIERTLVHELAHHISNDRNTLGFRRGVASVLGRVLPFDPLSLAIFYLSTPPQIASPLFWHEGLAQWAETAYADPTSVWGGRGRDPLTHMVWRLDAAAGGVPSVDQWRASWPQWPYGSRVYLYGAAYTRWLEGAYGGSVPFWSVVERQSHQWMFHFSAGAGPVLGQSHRQLIDAARSDLAREQEAALARIRTAPVTAAARLTPVGDTVAAPAWLPNGDLLFARNGRFGRPGQSVLAPDGRLRDTGRSAWAMGAVRSTADGMVVYAEADGTDDPWARSRIRILAPGATAATEVDADRLVQPDVISQGRGKRLAAIRLGEGGATSLILAGLRHRPGLVRCGWSLEGETTVAVTGRPWSPTFSPDGGYLAWIETDAAGSRLICAQIDDLAIQRVLWQVRGRILHPVWTTDGHYIYVTSDHTGVANAYRIDVIDGEARAVTNTIGGVLACVPRADGRELAIVDHDAQGPFVARISGDPRTWPGEAPAIAVVWPAPVSARPAPQVQPRPGRISDQAQPHRPLPAGTGEILAELPYRGLAELRPLFVTPTLAATNAGGLGLRAFASDPLRSHLLDVGAGVGLDQGHPVGQATYSASPWRVGGALSAWRVERVYGDQVVTDDGQRRDYVEQGQGAMAAVGTGLAGYGRRWSAYLGAGLERAKALDNYDERAVVSAAPWQGVERFVEVGLSYDDTTAFPTSYAREDGDAFGVRWRRSGFGGELDADIITAGATKVISVWPRLGQQLVLAGFAGWSGGDDRPQGRFAIGGGSGIGLPRGYADAEAGGDQALAWSVAYRASLWPAFTWFSTTPLGFRHLVGEVFYDSGQVTDDRPGGDGRWYRSAGVEVRGEWEYFLVRLAPGLGFARLFQGDDRIATYLTLGFAY
jgi:hypothetical protein